MHRSSSMSWHSMIRRGMCAAICLAATASAARADVAWHDSLPTARTACSSSGRPVLAIFVASWSPEATRFRELTLESPEVKGLIEACFEATIIDVDANPALTRRMEISHVPAACIFADKGKPLASFECPEQPLAFVAAASKAAQEAAALRATAGSATGTAMSDTVGDASTLAAAGFPSAPGDGDPLAPVESAAPGGSQRGSVSLVTAKVRQLSDFATGTDVPPTAVATMPTTDHRASRFRPAPDPAGTSATLSTAPPDWAATRAQGVPTFTNASDAPPPVAGIGIEPAAGPATAAPWLGGQTSSGAVAAALPTDEPESSATASDLADGKEEQSMWSSLVATVTKPFTKAPPRVSAPPTMPPSRPAMPVADAVTAAVTPQPEAVVADRYGSMPLGLEGYCPVTLADRGVWTEGRAQWGVRHRGRTYLFAGPEQQQAFLASPDRYAPVLSGDDPVVVVDQHRSAPGRRAFGVTYQSRMYLFSSAETRAQFTANPDRYTGHVMLAERPAQPDEFPRRY